ncbi:hypothetical protein WMY93_003684 [Mugilogobius chulae]|uniref:Ig-like domain-containing protein n=1 Tax=Mugilogobius chulae TaxID=88201 RepID=A0AAW0PXD7_9GOBI
MKQMFCFVILFTYLSLTKEEVSGEEEDKCISQPQKIIYSKTERSVVIPCTVTTSDCSHLVYKWFVFKENHHFELNIDQPNYSLDEASLKINSLNVSDSGVYHCAAISSQDPALQYIALGTTLVVQEPVKIMVRHILQWLSCILLAIYSVAIVSLIILKKCGHRQICRKNIGSTERTMTKRVQFHDVCKSCTREEV